MYTEFKPSKKRACKSAGTTTDGVGIDDDRNFIGIDNFDDPLAD